MTGRLYALTKIGPGDWSLLSNGLGTLYRFTRFEDGHHLGLDDGPRIVVRWWVRAIDTEDMKSLAFVGRDLDEMPWHDLGTCDTRREAITYAETHMERHQLLPDTTET